MKKLIEAFRNIFSTPDLRNRVLFTLALLGVYRLGAFIPTPGSTRTCSSSFLSRAAARCWASSIFSVAAISGV